MKDTAAKLRARFFANDCVQALKAHVCVEALAARIIQWEALKAVRADTIFNPLKKAAENV